MLFLLAIFGGTPGNSECHVMLLIPLLSVNFAFTVQSVKPACTKEPLCSLGGIYLTFLLWPRWTHPQHFPSPRKDTDHPSLLPCRRIPEHSCLHVSLAEGFSLKGTSDSGLNAPVINLGWITSIKLIFLRLESHPFRMKYFFLGDC